MFPMRVQFGYFLCTDCVHIKHNNQKGTKDMCMLCTIHLLELLDIMLGPNTWSVIYII